MSEGSNSFHWKKLQVCRSTTMLPTQTETTVLLCTPLQPAGEQIKKLSLQNKWSLLSNFFSSFQMNYRPWFEAALFFFLQLICVPIGTASLPESLHWNAELSSLVAECIDVFAASWVWQLGLGKFQAVGLYNSNLILQTKSKRLAELLKCHNKGMYAFCRTWRWVQRWASSHCCQEARKGKALPRVKRRHIEVSSLPRWLKGSFPLGTPARSRLRSRRSSRRREKARKK